MEPNLSEIVKHFAFEGRLTGIDSYNNGHINDTYVANFINEDGNTLRYVLQRINHNVFRTPEKLMENVVNITRHLREKIIASGGDPDRETINMISASDGKYYYKSEDGCYWRSYTYIDNAQTYQVVENLDHFYNAGKAFGRFQRLLSDFPVEKLHETIPDFHNTPKRYKGLKAAIEKDAFNRAAGVAREIKFIEKRAHEASLIVDLLRDGRLPLRVTHNDTKFNNVLIDKKTGKGICVIDLDTVMPGTSLYDFGDSIRSGANKAAEDEKDLSKVHMDIELYECFTRGFLECTRDFLTPLELEYLPFSAKLITFELGMRFLTDYLNGDKYFKICREGHNLDRARTQFKMVADIEEQYDEMMKIVEKYS